MRVRPGGRSAIAAAVAATGVVLALASRRRSAGSAITYPPLRVPKPFAPDIWIVDDGPLSAMGIDLPIRMAVVRLSDGGVFLHAPVACTPALAAAVAAIGAVRHIVAPSFAHWLFVAEWRRRFPEATVWAVPGLADRRAVRAADLRIDAELGADAPPEWSADMAQGLVPGGGGFCEAWFLHRRSRTLLLVDLVQNLEARRMPSIPATLMRALGATDATTPRQLRAILRLGGQGARQAIAAMVQTAPATVIFAHGRPFAADGATRLERAFAWLPGR